jgi:hypothetical protein
MSDEVEVKRAAVALFTAVEAATVDLDGILPVLKTKLDEDVFGLVDESVQKYMVALATFNKTMEKLLQGWVPKELRTDGPQPEQYDTFEAWRNARRSWVALKTK